MKQQVISVKDFDYTDAVPLKPGAIEFINGLPDPALRMAQEPTIIPESEYEEQSRSNLTTSRLIFSDGVIGYAG